MLGSVNDSTGGGWKVLILDDVTTRWGMRLVSHRPLFRLHVGTMHDHVRRGMA